MDDRRLWQIPDPSSPGATLECVMVSCCAGAELQLRRMAVPGAEPEIVLRELYPSKSDLYERSRMLHAEHMVARRNQIT
jgi:hypothetical protein